MSDSQFESWSKNPNAPEIPYRVYLMEKTWFAGTLVSSILYGMLIVLFFKCMAALFNPTYRRIEGVKWGLASYTLITFSLATVNVAMKAHVLSISYIDNREFPGVEDELYPGPFGYQAAISHKAISIIPIAAFRLNNWSADGLLLYRCYGIYSKSLSVVAFPFLMYLGSVAMGILSMCPTKEVVTINAWSSLAYLSISLSLNVLLTIMIVVRLILRGRSIRTATESQAGFSGLYKSTATMLVESSALFAMNSLSAIVSWALDDPVANVFTHTLSETQVIASLLIIQRVANKIALTGNAIAPGSISPFKAGSQGESTSHNSGGTPPSGYPMSSVGEPGTSSGKLGVRVETAINFHRDMV